MTTNAGANVDAQLVRLSYREKVSVVAMKEIITLALQEKLVGN